MGTEEKISERVEPASFATQSESKRRPWPPSPPSDSTRPPKLALDDAGRNDAGRARDGQGVDTLIDAEGGK